MADHGCVWLFIIARSKSRNFITISFIIIIIYCVVAVVCSTIACVIRQHCAK